MSQFNLADKTIHAEGFIFVQGKCYELASDGHLLNFNEWSEEMAKAMAKQSHIELFSHHWKMFRFIRDYYEKYTIPPSARIIKKELGDKVKAWGYEGKIFERAYPAGGCQQACRLAGIPSQSNY